MPSPGDTLEHRLFGIRLKWLETASSSSGERAVAELWISPGASEPPLHIHPQMDETISVIGGKARVRVGRAERSVRADKSVIVPASVPHTFTNGGQEELHVQVELSPALHWDEFLASAWSVRANARGQQKRLEIAEILRRYPDHVYLARIPIRVQKLVLAVMSAIAPLVRKARAS